MTLLEFLSAWGLLNDKSVMNLLAGFFERDIRTVQMWQQKTPNYVRWTLKQIHRHWQNLGRIDYQVFFDF